MTYQENDRIDYFFKGDEDNEPCNDVMIAKKLKNVEEGEFIKLRPSNHNNAVYQMGYYDKSIKKYWVEKFFQSEHGNDRALNGDTIVFTQFIF